MIRNEIDQHPMGFRLVMIEADGTERRGELFDSIGEALVEVTAIANDLADNPNDTDVVDVQIRPVFR